MRQTGAAVDRSNQMVGVQDDQQFPTHLRIGDNLFDKLVYTAVKIYEGFEFRRSRYNLPRELFLVDDDVFAQLKL